MPPGTGDAQLTLAQSVPVSVGINVTTPQHVALDDSRISLAYVSKTTYSNSWNYREYEWIYLSKL